MGAKVSYRDVLRQRNFALLWSGQTISWFGDSLYFVSLLWLVQEMTGSRAMMGLVAACRTVPSLFGFYAGALIDRWDRRRVMVFADASRALLVATIPLLHWAGWLAPWHIAAVAFGLASIGVFFLPARQALLPGIVGRDHLTEANALMSLSQQTVFLVGYAAGGLLISAIGVLPMFSIDAATFVVSAAAAWLIRLPAEVTRPASGAAKSQVLADVRAGLSFIGRNRALMAVAPLSILLNFVFAPMSVLMPSWVKDVLGSGADLFGYVQTANMVGMEIGSLLLGFLAARMRRSRIGLGGVLLMGLAIVWFAAARQVPVALVAMAVMGVANSVSNVIFTTWVQTVVPQELMGRVFGALGTVSQVAAPAGQAMAGMLGSIMPLPWLFGGAGGVAIALSALYWALPGLRIAFEAMDIANTADPAASDRKGRIAAPPTHAAEAVAEASQGDH